MASQIDCSPVPAFVKELCSVLQAAGHATYLVGGAVRDMLLGRTVEDWDLATAATPSEVQALFRKTIPTGLQHGTVTVLTGGGPVEITTFRGEGDYSDGRRPDRVDFIRELHPDLERRDFTINAIALDPLACELVDPLDGRSDLARKLIRAVGDAERRFAEDGLRPMRALRLATVLAFEIDPATLAAIPATMERFRLVSAERIRVELFKLLAAERPSVGLKLLEESGLGAEIFPGGAGLGPDCWKGLGHVLNALPPEPTLRLAALVRGALAPGRGERRAYCQGLAKRLRLSNHEADALLNTSMADDAPFSANASDPELRRFVRRHGRSGVPIAFDLWRAESRLEEEAPLRALRSRVDRVMRGPLALSIVDLAVDGRTLMGRLGKQPGPWLGAILAELLERVTDDPALNTRETLLELAEKQVRRQT